MMCVCPQSALDQSAQGFALCEETDAQYWDEYRLDGGGEYSLHKKGRLIYLFFIYRKIG